MCSLVARQGFEMFLGFGCCFGVLPLMGTEEEVGGEHFITLPIHYKV
jgi:hypothetical protein